MRKITICLLAVLLAIPCFAKSMTNVPTVEGSALHTIQSGWMIAEWEYSAQTQTNALAKTERTKLLLDALIAANANEEAQITVTPIPSKWNALRFRGIGITDGQAFTHQVYFGSLGDGVDCEYTYAGQLAWVTGTQVSIFKGVQIAGGGTVEPQPGDTLTGNTSGNTGVVHSTWLTAGSWSAGTAAGVVTMYSAGGQLSAAETCTLSRRGIQLSDDVLTVAANSATYEMADECVVTAAAWGSSWSTTSPADDDTNAETEIDRKNADLLVVVTTAAAVDCKLLVTGY